MYVCKDSYQDKKNSSLNASPVPKYCWIMFHIALGLTSDIFARVYFLTILHSQNVSLLLLNTAYYSFQFAYKVYLNMTCLLL